MRVHFQFLKRFQTFGFFLGIALLFGFWLLAGEAQSDTPDNGAYDAPAAQVPIPPVKPASLGGYDPNADTTTPTTAPAAAPATTGAAGGSGATGGAVTETQANEDYSACMQDKSDATGACTQQQSTAGMNGQQAAQMAQLQQQAQSANSATSQMTQAQAAQAATMCELQADLSSALGAMSAMKGNACSKVVGTCTSDCSQAASEYQSLITQAQTTNQNTGNVTKWQGLQKRAQKAGSACSGLSSNAGDMVQAAGSLLGGLLQNLMCAEMYATASPTPTTTGTCADPTFAATSILCVCQNDPKNAMCTGTQAFPTGLTTTAGDLGTQAPPQGTNDPGSLGALAVQPDVKPDSEKGSATTAEGGAGAGLQSPRANAPNPTGDDRPPGSNVSPNVITGTMGGGGGGGGGSAGGSSAAAAGARGGGGKGGFDLSKFLPKSPTRAPAGMTIPAKDGITGPMGPSIWQKISNQYQLQKANMIPEQQSN